MGICSTLALEVIKIIKNRKLTQAQAAKILDTGQSQISILKTGDCLQHFTFDRLVTWLTKLDCEVTVAVRQKPPVSDSGSPYISAESYWSETQEFPLRVRMVWYGAFILFYLFVILLAWQI